MLNSYLYLCLHVVKYIEDYLFTENENLAFIIYNAKIL